MPGTPPPTHVPMRGQVTTPGEATTLATSLGEATIPGEGV